MNKFYADHIQTALDVAGMVPVIGEVADGLNAAICLVRGDYVGAVLSAGATMPFAGNVATAGKWARKGANAVEAAGKAGKHADTARSACKGGEGACFTEGTQIVVGMTYDENDVFVQYVTANIEDIRVGDYVLACNVETGEVSLCPVTETYVRTSDHLRYLTVEDENGNIQTFETTDSHPFWVVTDNPDLERLSREFVDENGVILYHENIPVTEHGFYVEAGNLRAGDVFIGPNGELCTLIETERVEFPDGITVYNFEVAGNHNYYVIANVQTYECGATAILVHNAGHGYRVMSPDEYADASKGIWKDGSLVQGDAGEMGKKWLWDNKEAAKNWKDFCDANGEVGQVIAKVETANPVKTYPSFPHAPQGTAYHVPIPDLIKATK